MDVFTPNTGQTKNLLTGEERAANAEFRGWITKDGHHIPIGEDANSGGRGSKGSGKSAKKVDKAVKSGTIEKKPKSLNIGYKERKRLNHQIATDFPNLKPDGRIHNYENRNHFYRFTVNDFGNYNFRYKIKIVGNEDYIDSIRKKGK